MASKTKPLIALTMGDPSGIGPEVVLRMLLRRDMRRLAGFVVFGSGKIFRAVAGAHGLDVPLRTVKRLPKSPSSCATIPLVDVGDATARLALAGKPSAAGGRAAVAAILRAVELAKAGTVSAIVTAPINKEAIAMAGYSWPGHTELLEEQTGAPRAVMMMVGGELRVALVTTHAAISLVPKLITASAVAQTIGITHDALTRYFGIEKPHIAICGLNPHAGEAGRFGSEEARCIEPAVKWVQSTGIRCEGPLAADAIFAYWKKWDAIVAMYHDQANIPVKLLAFDRGVNVTLGLPIIRTSPDHGTAYDIVRRGKAGPRSMVAAVKLAVRMAGKRN